MHPTEVNNESSPLPQTRTTTNIPPPLTQNIYLLRTVVKPFFPQQLLAVLPAAMPTKEAEDKYTHCRKCSSFPKKPFGINCQNITIMLVQCHEDVTLHTARGNSTATLPATLTTATAGQILITNFAMHRVIRE